MVDANLARELQRDIFWLHVSQIVVCVGVALMVLGKVMVTVETRRKRRKQEVRDGA